MRHRARIVSFRPIEIAVGTFSRACLDLT